MITSQTFARRRPVRPAAVLAHTAAYTPDPPANMSQVQSYLVNALYDPQTQTTTVLDVLPDAGAPTPANPSSGFTLTSRDQQGNATGSAGTSETLIHVEHGSQPMLVSGKVPADKLHEIDLTSGGTGDRQGHGQRARADGVDRAGRSRDQTLGGRRNAGPALERPATPTGTV